MIKHKVDWELVCQKEQTQINKYRIRENCKIIDHDYKVRDKVIITNNSNFKYEIPYNVPFEVTQCWVIGVVTLQCGAIKISHNIRRIETYTYDANVEEIKF